MSFVVNPYRFGGGAPPATLPTPLNWWNLNSTSSADAGEGLYDQRGVFNLTNSGATQAATAGPDGQAVLDLDLGDYLTGSSKTWLGAGVDVSVSIWCELDALDTGGSSLISWRNNPGGDALLSLVVNNAATDFAFGQVWDDAQAQINTFADEDATVTVDGTVWTHLCWTFDGTTMTFYKDGVETGTGTGSFGAALETANIPFNIGRFATTGTSDTDGRLMSCGIFEDTLTADEVAYLASRPNDGYYADYTFV